MAIVYRKTKKEDENVIMAEKELTMTFGETSFSYYILKQIELHGIGTSQIDGVTGEVLTYDKLSDKSKRIATALKAFGMSPGVTIAITCENRLEYSTVMLASMFTGTVFAPINPTYSPDEIVHVLSISKPHMIFCSALTLKNVSLAFPKLKGIKVVVVFDDVPSTIPGLTVVSYKTLLQNRPIENPRLCEDSEIAVILTSSGTTGLPKGVMLSYANLKYFISYSRDPTSLNLHPGIVILGLLPLFHGYGFGLLLSSILIRMKYVIIPKFEEKLFLSSIEKYKINHLCLVPPLMLFLGKHPLVGQYDLSSVRTLICGAAPLSKEVTKEVQSRLPHVEIRQGYGLTEASIVITVTPPHSTRHESVGTLAPGQQAKIVDLESGKALKRGEQGELWVRGPCVMAGYCNDLQATRDMIDADGWLHTGDICYVDSEGFFYVVDRAKELIKYKGFQVAPAELESLLLGIQGIRDAAVVGVPDSEAGELPVAYVVRAPNSEVTKESIMSYVNSKVSPQKKLRDVRFLDSLPRNPSGKILRRVLRDRLKSKL